MQEYYSEITNNYFPEIQPLIEEVGGTVVYRFVGTWVGYGARLTGLFVVTDQNLYFRGKMKMTFGSSTMSMISSGTKAKNVFIIPLDAIYELVQKKNEFVLKHKLDYRGGKYIGKRDKIVIAMYQGKEGKSVESKEEWMKRANELKSYLSEKVTPLK